MVTPKARNDVPDGAPLERALGSTAKIKIIDSMSTFQSFDFSIQEIAGNAEISTKSVRRALPNLLRYGIITERRKIGRNTMYRYNVDNSLAAKLNSFIASVTDFDATIVAEQELASETHDDDIDVAKTVAKTVAKEAKIVP